MICENIQKINEEIAAAAKKSGRSPEAIKLVAVSKRHPVEHLMKAISCGHNVFGENYIQEVIEKKNFLQDKVNIHFIGNLQSNKAKHAAEHCTMIETIDRLKIVKAINKHLQETNRTIDILIQVNIGDDDNKSGTRKEETFKLIEEVSKLKQINTKGLMTIAPLEKDNELSRKHFANLRQLGEKAQAEGLFSKNMKIEYSMGMSGDYKIAIEEGATIIRVGTAIFGQRP
ncbi:MAG: YggS family pyridoxal phosphate-dependent enzyme [Desulfotalea sp.]